MLTTPGGMPACRTTSEKKSAESGVVWAGLRTTVFPHASAGAIFQASMRSGKFQGMICPATPSGRGRRFGDARDPVEVLRALGGRDLGPSVLERVPGGDDGKIDVLGSGHGHLRERLLG